MINSYYSPLKDNITSPHGHTKCKFSGVIFYLIHSNPPHKISTNEYNVRKYF